MVQYVNYKNPVDLIEINKRLKNLHDFLKTTKTMNERVILTASVLYL